MALRKIRFTSWQAVFNLKTLAFLVISCLFTAINAQAQVQDSIYHKPSLNNGMPPGQGEVPVIIREPEKQVKAPETKEEVKTKTKEYKEPVPFKHRLFTGGGFGLSFGNFTNVQLAPVLGYKITDWFAGGFGLTYIYIGDSFSSENFLGKKVFLQGKIYKGVFAHLEYERFSSFQEKYSVDATLGGAGYRQMLSDKVGLDLMLLLNLNQNPHSAYSSSLIRRFGIYIQL